MPLPPDRNLCLSEDELLKRLTGSFSSIFNVFCGVGLCCHSFGFFFASFTSNYSRTENVSDVAPALAATGGKKKTE